MPSRTTANCDAGATPIATSSSRTSGLTATRASVSRASVRSIECGTPSASPGRSSPRSVWPWNVWTTTGGRAGPASAGRHAPDRAPALAVCVWRTCGRSCRISSASCRTAPRVAERRDLALERRDRSHLDAALLGDEGHRRLALGDLAGRERRLVPARREPLGEIGDVERRSADVEAGDHAQHADRFVCSEHGRVRYRPLRADVHCCGAAEGIVLGVARGARVDARRLSGGGRARRAGRGRGACGRTRPPSRR